MICAAVLHDRMLVYAEVHHVPNRILAAQESLQYFVRWLSGQFECSLAVEVVNTETGEGVEQLRDALKEALLQASIPIWQVTESSLLGAYSIPPPRTRGELEAIALSFWPFVDRERHTPALIAALGGLYVQVERLLTPKSVT
jgi:hypothetical protein